MSIIPWSKKEVKPSLEVQELRDVAVQEKSDIVIRNNNGPVIQVRAKTLLIAGEKRRVDPYQLIRMIKRVTQEIGSYKHDDDIYADIIVRALRKARGDIVNILENEFGIHWQINNATGESNFYM